jgi:(p)ppGpp synthase/HD superfamily hydrolase
MVLHQGNISLYEITNLNDSKIRWTIEQHKNVNHYYDQYIPYEYHLRMVIYTAYELKDYFIKKYPSKNYFDWASTIPDVFYALWGHDLIEDTRTSYNDCAKNLGVTAASIIYAVTNEKGKTREERANDKYYEGIRKIENAVFVKLCDRIANVTYSKMTHSNMFEKYKNENRHFIESLGFNEVFVGHELYPAFDKLINLFK